MRKNRKKQILKRKIWFTVKTKFGAFPAWMSHDLRGQRFALV